MTLLFLPCVSYEHSRRRPFTLFFMTRTHLSVINKILSLFHNHQQHATLPCSIGTMKEQWRRCRRLFLRSRQSLILFLILVVASTQIYLVEQQSIQVQQQNGDSFSNGSPGGLGRSSSSSVNITYSTGPIFYNLFAPRENRKDVQRMVREQILQRNWTLPNATIYYTLIGDPTLEAYVTSQCSNNCHMREYMDQGDEEHTLQALWDYCQKDAPSNDDEDVWVTYIHDKGSYHASRSNEKARRMATKAAMECQTSMTATTSSTTTNFKCNVCMAAFHAFPQYLASANMWAASCSYIRGLYPPRDYANKLQEMYDTTLNHSVLQYSADYVCLKPYERAANFWGLGRYALERWVLSHPFVKPCEVLPMGEREVSYTDFPQEWQAKLRKAPTSSAKKSGIEQGPYKSTFARLKGRLFEWDYMYQLAPPPHSWIWKFYKGYEDGAPVFLRKCQSFLRNVTLKEDG